MKKSLFLLMLLSACLALPLQSQGLLNRVKKAVTKEISGITGNDDSKTAPEPSCSCDDAIMIVDMKKYNLDYKEISLTTALDGSILIRDKQNQKYYVIKDGQTKGPFNENDPQLAIFNPSGDSSGDDKKDNGWEKLYPGVISKSGEKYLIKFNGRNYGPYAIINDFTMTKSKNKFAAIVTENVVMTEAQGKKLEEAMNNAKTDQERMDIAMKMSQQVQNQMMQGGASSIQPKMVSSISGAVYDPMTMAQGRLVGNAKYDDILMVTPNEIYDLKGVKVLTLSENSYQLEKLFVSSSNNKYATYTSGTLTFSDRSKMSDLFNPYLISTDGKTFLTYMYYSPGKDGIMQCSVPF
jgi:hypothetical protein